ncbi:MAG: hypothetical protein ACXVCN_10710 [Bdellovibrio sp.]
MKITFSLLTAIGYISTSNFAHAESSSKIGSEYCKIVQGSDDGICGSVALISSLMPTYWPVLTVVGAQAISQKLSMSLSSTERAQMAMVSTEAAEVLTNYDAKTETVHGQVLSPNFVAAKATLESHLKNIDAKEVGLNKQDLDHLTDGQAALLMVSLSN